MQSGAKFSTEDDNDDDLYSNGTEKLKNETPSSPYISSSENSGEVDLNFDELIKLMLLGLSMSDKPGLIKPEVKVYFERKFQEELNKFVRKNAIIFFNLTLTKQYAVGYITILIELINFYEKYKEQVASKNVLLIDYPKKLYLEYPGFGLFSHEQPKEQSKVSIHQLQKALKNLGIEDVEHRSNFQNRKGMGK